MSVLLPNGEAQVYGAFLDEAGVVHVMFWGGRIEQRISIMRAPQS